MFGKLESAVIEIVWSLGSVTVHDVAREMDRPLAYTTVMTTLDRLFKKGLLDREMDGRMFRYTPKVTRAEWEQKQAREWFASFLANSSGSDLLLSSLVNAVVEQDSALLDELERKIVLKRQQLKNSNL